MADFLKFVTAHGAVTIESGIAGVTRYSQEPNAEDSIGEGSYTSIVEHEGTVCFTVSPIGGACGDEFILNEPTEEKIHQILNTLGELNCPKEVKGALKAWGLEKGSSF
jgi:hypothetical protein